MFSADGSASLADMELGRAGQRAGSGRGREPVATGRVILSYRRPWYGYRLPNEPCEKSRIWNDELMTTTRLVVDGSRRPVYGLILWGPSSTVTCITEVTR